MLYWLFIIIFSTGPVAAWLKMCIIWQSIRDKNRTPQICPPPKQGYLPGPSCFVLTAIKMPAYSTLVTTSVSFCMIWCWFFIHPSRREKFLQSWQEVIKGNLIQPFHWSIIVRRRTIKLHIRCRMNMIRYCFQYQKEDKGERKRFNQ